MCLWRHNSPSKIYSIFFFAPLWGLINFLFPYVCWSFNLTDWIWDLHTTLLYHIIKQIHSTNYQSNIYPSTKHSHNTTPSHTHAKNVQKCFKFNIIHWLLSRGNSIWWVDVWDWGIVRRVINLYAKIKYHNSSSLCPRWQMLNIIPKKMYLLPPLSDIHICEKK